MVGLCEEIAPDVFFGMDDGLFYVKESADTFGQEKLFDSDANPAGSRDGPADHDLLVWLRPADDQRSVVR